MNQRRPSPLQKVLGQLTADHREIQALLRVYADESTPIVRHYLLSRFCAALRLHCALEAGVLIPALARANDDAELLTRTGTAYGFVMGLINEVAGTGDSERLKGLVSLLQSYVNEHVAAAEAEGGLLDQARYVVLDWAQLDREMTARRAVLAREIYQGAGRLEAPAGPA